MYVNEFSNHVAFKMTFESPELYQEDLEVPVVLMVLEVWEDLLKDGLHQKGLHLLQVDQCQQGIKQVVLH